MNARIINKITPVRRFSLIPSFILWYGNIKTNPTAINRLPKSILPKMTLTIMPNGIDIRDMPIPISDISLFVCVILILNI